MTEPQEHPRSRRPRLSLSALLAFALCAIGAVGTIGLWLPLPVVARLADALGHHPAILWLILMLLLLLGGILGLISTIRIDASHGRLKGVTLGVTAMAMAIICSVFMAIPTVRLISEILNDH